MCFFVPSSQSNENVDDKQPSHNKEQLLFFCCCQNRLEYLCTSFNRIGLRRKLWQWVCVCSVLVGLFFFLFSFESSDLPLTLWLIIFHLYLCCFSCCNSFLYNAGVRLIGVNCFWQAVQCLRCHVFVFALVRFGRNFQLISAFTDDQLLTKYIWNGHSAPFASLSAHAFTAIFTFVRMILVSFSHFAFCARFFFSLILSWFDGQR